MVHGNYGAQFFFYPTLGLSAIVPEFAGIKKRNLKKIGRRKTNALLESAELGLCVFGQLKLGDYCS